ncbi:MAG: protein-glutamate O-methyltransferase family protein [Chlorobium limicola]|uniref:damage-control phosphatase ARMT1 family protein n=1 Tax=Chlorobium limicola TaxID=1092 RepID=UPI0023F1DE6F|nr:damage-control phosphatase ARMT1 family protein [Chlorobium limicola]NTV21630.1 protein-glutamate O-methyltransferase family protein [Chlorobium limicola]
MNSNRRIAAICYPCIFEQLHSLARVTGLDEEEGKMLFEHSMRHLLATHGEGLVVQHIIRSATDRAIALSGKGVDYDPYGAIKKQSNDIARQFAGGFRNKIRHSSEPLRDAVKIAAAGNIIDFGAKRHGSLDIEMELSSIDERAFGRFDFAEFSGRLKLAGKLLYICDNAGEIVFDRLFIEEIRRSNPGLEVTCAVRALPIINDAVLADAHDAGLFDVAEVVSSGSVYPGTLFSETSDEFRGLFDNADVIISKGQGNFETLLDVADERLFFILRIKCDQMAKLSRVAKGELVLMQGRGKLNVGCGIN